MPNTTSGLIGHWPLAADTNDHSAASLLTEAVGIELGAEGPRGEAGTAGRFNGTTSVLEVADQPALQLGHGDFSVAAWIHTNEKDTDVVGDIAGKFDTENRRGFNLAVVTNGGVTSTSQANRRHLQFGIDDGRPGSGWQDCGRPGNAVFIGCLAACGENLYAGTIETGKDEIGHLFRYDGGDRWTDLGNPVGCNGILSVAEFNGELYCGTSRYAVAGSALRCGILNNTRGGAVYRVQPDGTWDFCGHPGEAESLPDDEDAGPYNMGKADDIGAMAVYRGQLYCISNHLRGLFRYEGGETWTNIGPGERLMSLPIYRGDLYVLVNGGPVYRYRGGSDWEFCGCPAGSTQTYAAAIHDGRMYVGTWPEGSVHVYEGGESWRSLGRAGYEMEIMAMALYNGKIYLGGLPTANVYRMDGERFTLVGNVDQTAAYLRRAWSMAVYDGSLYVGTLPGGHVRSITAGRMATWDRPFPGGWHHVAAVRQNRRLKLFVDGRCVALSGAIHPSDYNLTCEQPLRIGFGSFEHFEGLMSDVRLYGRALADEDVTALVT